MKKLITLALLAAIATALVGCGAKEEGDTAATPTNTATAPPVTGSPTDDKAAASPSTTDMSGEPNKPVDVRDNEKPTDDKGGN